MNIDGLTIEQIISLALIKGTSSYEEAFDYDVIDWLEWCWIHRN